MLDLPYGKTAAVWDAHIDHRAMWREIRRIRKPRAAIVMFAMQPFTSLLVVSNIREFLHETIWVKKHVSGHLNAKRRPLGQHESILLFADGQPTYNPQMQKGAPKLSRSNKRVVVSENATTAYNKSSNYGNVRTDEYYPTSVVTYSTGARARSLHQNQKPTALLEYLIRTYSHPGDLVLDFTMGSGSTGEACATTGRRFVGVELYPLADRPIDRKTNPDYFNVAAQRIAAAYARAAAEQQQSLDL